jgi:hypothetical protein
MSLTSYRAAPSRDAWLLVIASDLYGVLRRHLPHLLIFDYPHCIHCLCRHYLALARKAEWGHTVGDSVCARSGPPPSRKRPESLRGSQGGGGLICAPRQICTAQLIFNQLIDPIFQLTFQCLSHSVRASLSAPSFSVLISHCFCYISFGIGGGATPRAFGVTSRAVSGLGCGRDPPATTIWTIWVDPASGVTLARP